MERLVGGITMHKPHVPPSVVLTLGNGFDFWAIRAAQEWPVCISGVTSRNLLVTPLTSIAEMPSHCT